MPIDQCTDSLCARISCTDGSYFALAGMQQLLAAATLLLRLRLCYSSLTMRLELLAMTLPVIA
jgi:hypothetical protein